MLSRHFHILIAGSTEFIFEKGIESALLCHTPIYEKDQSRKTRISAIVDDPKTIDDFIFEYKELMDNSYWRIVDLTCKKPKVQLYRPKFEGIRKDFVDVEWEFIIGHLSHPMLQEKIRRWAADAKQHLTISLGFEDSNKNSRYAEKFRRRLPDSVTVEVNDDNPETKEMRDAELMEMAKYLHYFYQASYDLKHVPTELPEEEVEKAWDAVKDEKLKRSNILNVMAIPVKMQILGHDRHDWDAFYALTAEEIEMLTAVEHNRWCVERLIQGMRPCTDLERKEIEEDLRMRLADAVYASENPESLKKKYKSERNAHFDLCAFSELGVDETGLPVSRYDRDLTAAIPLIVKTFNDRHKNNG